MSPLTSASAATLSKATLENAGTTLICLGGISLFVKGWDLWHGIDYDPDFGLVLIVTGILLYRQGMKTAKYVRLFALLGLPSNLLFTVLGFFLFPLDYQAICFKLYPWDWVASTLQNGLFLIFLFWLQNILSREEIAYAQVDRRITPFAARTPLGVGTMIGVVSVAVLYLALHSWYPAKAIAIAEDRFGQGFKYFANGLHWELGQKVDVELIAYNSGAIHQFSFHFKEPAEDPQ